MIVLSALVHLPTPVVTAFGAVMIAGHNLLDPIQSSNPVWSVLHRLNFIVATPRHSVFVAYTLIPWVGVTAVGYEDPARKAGCHIHRRGIRPGTSLCLGL